MNIRDIARLADVSPGTVSKVLNNYPDISESTRRRVMQVIQDNQYDSRSNPRSPKSGPPSIGLVIEGVFNELYSVLEDLLSVKIHNSGCTLISFHDNYFSQDKMEKFEELKDNIERSRLCGMIYIGGNFQSIPGEILDSLPCPTVFINTVLPERPDRCNYSSVQVAHYEAARMQMQHLIDKGHRDICTVISSTRDISVYGLRTQGYRDALIQNGLAVNLDRFLTCDYEAPKAYSAVHTQLRRIPEITAVCCSADTVIPGVLRAIYDLGKTPGKDVAVISFDGLTQMAYSIPSVTTLAQPLQEISLYSYNLLFGLIDKEREHQRITFQPIFLKRESC